MSFNQTGDSNQNKDFKDTDALLDDEMLVELFSSFESVRASDALKAAALAAALDQDREPDTVSQNELDATPESELDEAPEDEPDASSKSEQTSSPAEIIELAKLHPKLSRFKRFAVAASIALVAFGGAVAYATPTAFVSVEDDDANIELGINMFGMTVSATGDDAGKELLDAVEPRHKSFEQSLDLLLDELDKRTEEKQAVGIEIRGGFGDQEHHLEERSEQMLDKKGFERKENKTQQEAQVTQTAQDSQASDVQQASQALQPAQASQDSQAPQTPGATQAPQSIQVPQAAQTSQPAQEPQADQTPQTVQGVPRNESQQTMQQPEPTPNLQQQSQPEPQAGIGFESQSLGGAQLEIQQATNDQNREAPQSQAYGGPTGGSNGAPSAGFEQGAPGAESAAPRP